MTLLPPPGTLAYAECFPVARAGPLTEAELWQRRAWKHKRDEPYCVATGRPAEESHHYFGRGIVSRVGYETDAELVPLTRKVHNRITARHQAYGKRRGWTDGKGRPLGNGDRYQRNRELYNLRAIPRATRQVLRRERFKSSLYRCAFVWQPDLPSWTRPARMDPTTME